VWYTRIRINSAFLQPLVNMAGPNNKARLICPTNALTGLRPYYEKPHYEVFLVFAVAVLKTCPRRSRRPFYRRDI
jgi:hypothetical protein